MLRTDQQTSLSLHLCPLNKKKFLGMLHWILITFLITPSQGLGASAYHSKTEYENLHPDQVLIGREFGKRVRESATPTKQSIPLVKVAIVYPGKQASDYWRRSVSSFKARLSELNIPFNIQEHFTKPNTELRLQKKYLQKAIIDNPDYLIFTLDAQKHSRWIEQIIALGQPKVILQNITTPLKKWGASQPFLYVGFDHRIGSRMLANYFSKNVPAGSKYGVLYFGQGYVANMRGAAFISTIQKNTDFKVADSYVTNGSVEDSLLKTQKMLKANKDLAFIYAGSTDVALGAIKAIKKLKKEKILLNGWGGGSSELKELSKGNLHLTVMRMNDDNGVAMAEAIYLDKIGQTKKVPTIYSGDFELVTDRTAKATIERLKQRAFRYSQ